MSNCPKLRAEAERAPNSIRFQDALSLTECRGFVPARTKGSHHIYKRPGFPRILNFEPDSNKAKMYQVRQLPDAIEILEQQGVSPNG
jgi:HicA toxin of bacterial toxin-antitoxin,